MKAEQKLSCLCLYARPSRPLSVSDTSSSQRSPLAIVSADGWVHSNSHHMLTSTCRLNLQLFPFDRQKCNISFGSLSSSGESGSSPNPSVVFSKETTDGFCLQHTDEIISMRVHGQGSSRFRMYNQTMVTHGEWALKYIQPTSYMETKTNFTQSAVVYEVRHQQQLLLLHLHG